VASLPAFWRRDGSLARALSPLVWVFRRLAGGRRRRLAANACRLGAPVLVVGSVFVGGSGKTPLVGWLARRARTKGYRPGIVLRGYGGGLRRRCLAVHGASDPRVVGDEAVMTARATNAPVYVGRDRCRAAAALLASSRCDLVISDDGLQHYRLGRDAEVAVLDSDWGLGNGRCLPAGPLREPPERLREVDLVVANGGPRPDLASASFRLRPTSLAPVTGSLASRSPPDTGQRVHAVAAIGVPARFFNALRDAGFQIIPHAFADHHRFHADDLAFGDSRPVVMTAKDAVKCEGFDDGRLWYMPVELYPDAALVRQAEDLIERLCGTDGADHEATSES